MKRNVTIDRLRGASVLVLILFASHCAPFVRTRLASYDPLAYLGRLSYEVYLFHMTSFALLNSIITHRYPGLILAVALLCVVTVSDLIARFYAEPLNRLVRAVLLPVRPRPTVEAVPASAA